MSPPPLPPLDSALAGQIKAEVERLKPWLADFRRADLATSWPSPAHVSYADLKAMAGLQHLFFDHHFSSHRKLIGPLIVLAKRWTVGLANRLLRITLVRQVELNQHLWNLALTVRLLDDRLSQLEARLGPSGEAKP